MACVIVPVTQAVITTVAAKAIKAKEEKNEKNEKNGIRIEKEGKIPFSRKLKWLNNLLWGGSALLVFEHVWHGELSPLFPFLTGATSAEGIYGILREMATAGVAMSALVTAAWLVMLAVTSVLEKKARKEEDTATEESV